MSADTRVGAEVQHELVEAVRVSLAERYGPGIGVWLGAGAWIITAHAS